MIDITNTKRGIQAEILFKNSVTKQKRCWGVIKKSLSINSNSAIRSVDRIKSNRRKADVMIVLDDGINIGVNIQSYKNSEAGFNHAMRTHPEKFIKKFNIPQDIGKIIIDSLLRKALIKVQYKRNDAFILPQDSDAIIGFFSRHALDIVRYSICGDEKPELLVLFNREEGKMQIYLMKNVLELMNNIMDVHITKRWGVIRLNKFFTIQKKGGDGGHKKYNKTDIKHPWNDIQVKINTAPFAEKINPLCIYSTKP